MTKRARLNSSSTALMRMLACEGSIDRDTFYEAVRANRAYVAVHRLAHRGLIKCEVRLTEQGLRALGLKGPST